MISALLLAWIAPASAMTLEEAWQAVEARSQEAAMVEEQRLQSGLVKTQAYAALSPKFNIGGNYTINQREVALDFSKSFPQSMLDLIEQATGNPIDFGEPRVIQLKDFFDANASISQPLFSARALPGIKAAYAMSRAGDAQAAAGHAQLKVGVARAYWGVLVARDGARVAADGLSLAKKHAEQVAAFVAAGTATRQASLQAEMAVARAERELAGAEARRVQAEMGFAALVEVEPGVALTVPESSNVHFASADEALTHARDKRPELRAAHEQYLAAKYVKTATNLSWMPTVDGRFIEMWTENTAFNGYAFNWMAGLNASWTFWDGGFRIAEQRRASSQARMALAALEKADEDAEIEVRSAWEDLNRARRARAAAERELALATENLRLAEVSYSAGVSTFLELEDARVAKDGAELSTMAERMGEHIATLTLARAVGDL